MKTHRLGDYEYWYDNTTEQRCWWAARMIAGRQFGDAFHAATKEEIEGQIRTETHYLKMSVNVTIMRRTHDGVVAEDGSCLSCKRQNYTPDRETYYNGHYVTINLGRNTFQLCDDCADMMTKKFN